MGHGPGSKTFLNSYKAQTSTVDLQAMMHNYEGQRDVLNMSSMALGRSKDAPLPLSAKGEDMVMADLSPRADTPKGPAYVEHIEPI